MELDTTSNKDASPAPAVTFTSPNSKKPKRSSLKAALLTMLIIAIAGGGAVACWMRDQQAKKDLGSKDSEIALLNSRLNEGENTDGEEADTDATSDDPKTVDEVHENIAAAISSGNTSALAGYMASSVRVIIAASGGVGDRTPAQAISDLAYLDDATDPWDFALSADTLNDYANGDYAQYFPRGAVVGKSADDRVVSFTFDANGDINGVFMAVDAELLLP